MKKVFLCALALALFLSSCTQPQDKVPLASQVITRVKENQALLLSCVEEMKAFGQERIYVAMEEPKKKKDEKETTEEPNKTLEKRLVSFEKESDDRTEIENEILHRAIETLDIEVIFFQTASDARQCVIFSFTRENDEGVQNGFYYSFDTLPCAWWGRSADLKHKENRWIQMNQNEDAWYYTVKIENNFYYFEKQGYLLA